MKLFGYLGLLSAFIFSPTLLAKTCTTGKVCGDTCIASNNVCHLDTTITTSTVSSLTPVQRFPAASSAVARDKNGNVLNKNAQFIAGISLDDTTYARKATVKLTDKISVHTKINYDNNDIGQPVKIIITALYEDSANSTPLFFMLNEYTQVKAWDQKISSLIPFSKMTASNSDLEISIYEGNFLATGILQIFIHYQLADGTLISAADPIEVTIQ